MGRKYEHWNDGKYQKPKFEIGVFAEQIQTDVTKYVLHDFKLDGKDEIQRIFLIRRLEKALDYCETISHTVRDANSIRPIYGVDFEERRVRWLSARGYCFRLMSILDSIAVYVHKDTNIQKYVNLSEQVLMLAGMIQNIIRSDDRRKKKECKEYLGVA